MKEEKAVYILKEARINQKCKLVCPDNTEDCLDCENEAIQVILKLYEKQKDKIKKIKEIVDIYNNTKGEFATLPNGEEICISDNEPIIVYLQEILEEEN